MEHSTGSKLFVQAQEALNVLQSAIPTELQKPCVGIICGTGLGSLVSAISPETRVEIPYAKIPYFVESTVQGHAGKLVFGRLRANQTPVVLMMGRTHFYEGHRIQDITFPVRVFKLLGITVLIVTNAAGGLNHDYRVGDIVVLNDHLNLAGFSGVHPLRGPNADEFGVRFPPLSDAYDLSLRRSAHRAWKELKNKSSIRRLHEGVYAFVGGPSYETRAECRMLRALGADVVGMSTVPEIIVARHSDIRVLALSLVTNNAILGPGPRGDGVDVGEMNELDALAAIQEGKANHQEVLEAGSEAATDMQVRQTSTKQFGTTS